MWLSVVSIVGNIASILALPSLGLIYWELYKVRKAARIPRGVSEDAVEFLYSEGRVAINLVPIASLQFLPRKGDTVLLPSETGQPGAGLYEVTDICHCYGEETKNMDFPCQARLGKVVAYVKKKT